MEKSILQQENSSLKDQLEKQISSANPKIQYNDIENEHLLILLQKGIKTKIFATIKINF
jgi:hypothetical protein